LRSSKPFFDELPVAFILQSLLFTNISLHLASMDKRTAESEAEQSSALEHGRRALLNILQRCPAEFHSWAFFRLASCKMQLGNLKDAVQMLTLAIEATDDVEAKAEIMGSRAACELRRAVSRGGGDKQGGKFGRVVQDLQQFLAAAPPRGFVLAAALSRLCPDRMPSAVARYPPLLRVNTINHHSQSPVGDSVVVGTGSAAGLLTSALAARARCVFLYGDTEVVETDPEKLARSTFEEPPPTPCPRSHNAWPTSSRRGSSPKSQTCCLSGSVVVVEHRGFRPRRRWEHSGVHASMVSLTSSTDDMARALDHTTATATAPYQVEWRQSQSRSQRALRKKGGASQYM